MEATETSQDRKREEILRVATEFFAQRGYAETDLQRVADALGIGKGTIYRMFPSKEAVFLAAAERGMHLLRDEVDRATDGVTDPLKVVSLGVRAYLRFFADHPEIVEIFCQERASFRDREKPTYFAHIETSIEPWHQLYRGLIAKGVVRDIPVKTICDAMCYMTFGAMFTNHVLGKPDDIEQQADALLDIVFNGLLAARA